MLVVIPLSASDAHLIPDFAAAMQHFGPYRSHEAVIMPSEAVLTEAENLKNLLATSFPLISIVPARYQGQGWPLAPNRHFRECALWVQNNRQGKPWYFFELDNTPTGKGWLNTLEALHTESGKPYMGAVVPTRIIRQTSAGPVYMTEGRHMVGTGIYPWNAYGRSIILKTCDVQYVWSDSPLKPFDVQMAQEIEPHVMATNLIAHRWRTVNYRYDGDRLVCDDQPGNPPGTSHAAPVPAEALVVHGCRDGSLARLITDGDPAIVHAVTFEKSWPEPSPSPVTPHTSKVIPVQIKVERPAHESAIPDRETPPWAPPVAPPPVAPPPVVEQKPVKVKDKPVSPQPVVAKKAPLKDRILEIVKVQNKRVGQLARELKTTPRLIQQAVVRNGAELQIVPPGWVKPRVLEEIK